jgi:2-polyprenyl-6-methoxyphenol hydroxylase-like FAD-dependent oxidoreductase
LAAAIAARAAGDRVTLFERAQPPVDKACGEGILPAGIDALRSLGVHIAAGEGFTIRGIRFLSDGVSAEAEFPSNFGLGLRRTRLQEILLEHAARAGVQLVWGAAPEFPGETPAFRWVIGADGIRSRIRCAADLGPACHDSSRFGFRRHYQVAPWTDLVEVYWGENCQVYVTPVGSGEIGVALLTRDAHLRLDQALTAFPALQRAGWTALRQLRRSAAD